MLRHELVDGPGDVKTGLEAIALLEPRKVPEDDVGPEMAIEGRVHTQYLRSGPLDGRYRPCCRDGTGCSKESQQVCAVHFLTVVSNGAPQSGVRFPWREALPQDNRDVPWWHCHYISCPDGLRARFVGDKRTHDVD